MKPRHANLQDLQPPLNPVDPNYQKLITNMPAPTEQNTDVTTTAAASTGELVDYREHAKRINDKQESTNLEMQQQVDSIVLINAGAIDDEEETDV